jgi:hypothetical protein
LEQSTIAELEDVSQSLVSKKLQEARKNVPRETLAFETSELWSDNEIKYIHMLPREILPDMVAIAFINNILGVYPVHGFFSYLDTSPNARIVALSWLGVQNKRLMEIFNKNQSTISMIVKRSTNKIINIQRVARYESVENYKLENEPKPVLTKKFLLAGGQLNE